MTIENNTFSIKFYFVVLGVDPNNLKQYILLNNDNSIPSFYLNKDNVNNLEKYSLDFILNLIFVDPVELMPQLINLNSSNIDNKDANELNLVYGFIVNYTKNIHDSVVWQEFSYNKSETADGHITDSYRDIIFEVSQKLK